MKFSTLLTRHLTCFLLSSSAFACSAEGELDAPEATPRAAPTEAESRAEVCDLSNQVVVFSQESSCDDVGPWEGERIFGGSGEPQPPAGLRGYCRYTKASNTTQGHVDALAAGLTAGDNSPAFEIGTDCRAVETQNSAIADEVGTDLEDFFGWLSGRFDPQDITVPPPISVHTAIVDTYPNDSPDKPKSSHGPVVASIVESFLCPTGVGCTHPVRNYLGLPRTNDGLNLEKGGQIGLQSDLAKGIYAALVEDSQLGTDRLIINLSVAWEAEQFGGMGLADMDPAARSVFDIIRVARCRGALIIAAAGNESSLSCTGEPMAPGRWEQIPAPDEAECVQLGVLDWVEDTAAYTPLVHAVGGLFGPDTAMATSRSAGMPRLAAASSHAVAPARLPGLPGAAIRTGTSVGTAVASATAAMVWGYAPALTPSGVMERLYLSGHPVGDLTADFGSAGSTPVHRIDACAAVALSIPGPGPTCDFSTQPVTIGQLVGDLEAVVSISHSLSVDDPLECTNVCGEQYSFHPVPGSARDCAEVEPDPWRWLTTPQPTEAGCDECVLTTETSTDQATALLTVGDHFDAGNIKSVDLEIIDVFGMPHFFGITDKELQQAAVVEPRSGFIDEFVVPMKLDGVLAERGFVIMSFLDPADPNGASIETRDPLILRTLP
ncbi:MAG: S8/S53 family peptidase [Nannocystales bacterium]